MPPTGPSWWLQVGVQWVHVVAVGIWIGGLAALLVAVRGLPSEAKAKAVRTFSTWAGLGIAAVAGTGFLRGLSEVQTIGALFGTSLRDRRDPEDAGAWCARAPRCGESVPQRPGGGAHPARASPGWIASS